MMTYKNCCIDMKISDYAVQRIDGEYVELRSCSSCGFRKSRFSTLDYVKNIYDTDTEFRERFNQTADFNLTFLIAEDNK